MILSNSYYVYLHQDPISKRVLYVGHGKGVRAWSCGSTSRSEEHVKHLSDMMEQGFIPSDWVVILHRGLSKKQAAYVERGTIKEYGNPQFNKNFGEKVLVWTKETFATAKGLREDGLSYEKIAKKLGISAMTVHRAINNNTPALEIYLEKQ
jgi:DNA-binding NarL/FixJ family response regulator